MRNLRQLGLTLVSALAICGAVAVPAAGDEFTAEKYTTFLAGEKDFGTTDFLTLTSGTVACKNPNYGGAITASTTTLSFIPSFHPLTLGEPADCTAFGFPAEVDMQGCSYLVHVGGGPSTEGDLDLQCEAGKSVLIIAVSAETVKCTVHIKPQSDIGGTVKYKNIGSGTTREITAEVSLTGIDYSHTKGSGLGACTAGSSTTGTLSAKAVVTGVAASGHVGIFMS